MLYILVLYAISKVKFVHYEAFFKIQKNGVVKLTWFI